MSSLEVPARFCGPASSGNGGWTSGALAALVPTDGPVEVTLRRPPPLDTVLLVEEVDGVLVASSADGPVAEARPVPGPLPVVEPVPADLAASLGASYAGHRTHPFPTCFSCGTAREPGDGLRIFPGMVAAGSTVAAATWTPHASLEDPAAPGRVTEAVTWAALDCVGAWSSHVEERPMVLGRMTALVTERPRIGDVVVVVGQWVDQQGRKVLTRSALYADDDRLLASAEHVWITVDPRDFT